MIAATNVTLLDLIQVVSKLCILSVTFYVKNQKFPGIQIGSQRNDHHRSLFSGKQMGFPRVLRGRPQGKEDQYHLEMRQENSQDNGTKITQNLIPIP